MVKKKSKKVNRMSKTQLFKKIKELELKNDDSIYLKHMRAEFKNRV